MKTLKDFDFGRRAGGRTVYDWDFILNGDIHLLEEGKDFECKRITMKTRSRQVAKSKGLKARVADTKEGVIVQAVGVREEGTEATPPSKRQSRRRR